ncbi:MAG TPA: hypothetical protein VNO70_21130 [Blastocatellia bacterium]|nr:hypothetical protein [Blastocatellia bacterium]
MRVFQKHIATAVSSVLVTALAMSGSMRVEAKGKARRRNSDRSIQDAGQLRKARRSIKVSAADGGVWKTNHVAIGDNNRDGKLNIFKFKQPIPSGKRGRARMRSSPGFFILPYIEQDN